MTEVEEIKGFLVVPVLLKTNSHLLKSDSSIPPTIRHYMYIKKQSAGSNKALSERSLFLINPPLDTKFTHIKEWFKEVSKSSLLESFMINDEGLDYEINLTKLTSDLYEDDESNKDSQELKLPNGTGLIVFVDKSAANLAFSNLKKYIKKNELYQWRNNTDVESSASIRFINEYKNDKLDLEQLSEKVSENLQAFELKEQKSINELSSMKEIVDEDGFTLVVGKNRKTKRGILGKIEGVTKHKTEANLKRANRLEKKDFYKFQLRERKKNEMNELLKKFKDDQERIKQLKEKKRFRPY